jgi:dephospho-CoA kinase
LAAEFDGEVEETSDGAARYRFPEILRLFQGAEVVRRHLQLERSEVGDIVYSSDESREEANQREIEAFEREMERQDEMERYLQNPDRVAYMDEFELVAFEEELELGRALRA